VPINRATTVSTALATSMKGFAVSWRCSECLEALAALPRPVQTFYLFGCVSAKNGDTRYWGSAWALLLRVAVENEIQESRPNHHANDSNHATLCGADQQPERSKDKGPK